MISAQFAGGKLTATSRFFRLFVQSVALGLGALLAIAGDISAGAIIASSVLLSRALQPIESIIGGWSSLGSARAAAQRLSRALENHRTKHASTRRFRRPRACSQVEEVGLRGRDGRPILVGVSFRADPGKILGIIGPSGSGKTTLGKILVGALQPTVGTVRIDGARLTDWDQDELGKHLGYMPQEPSLFEGTIKENIARFARHAAARKPRRSTKQSSPPRWKPGVHELILQLPQGYDTPLGLMGAGLSAGQAQRIALARALYGDPRLLVLDEPNAFLDQTGEAALLRAHHQGTGAGSDGDRHRAPPRSPRSRRPAAGARRRPSKDDRPGVRGGRPPHWTQGRGECGVSEVVALQPIAQRSGQPARGDPRGLLVAILFFVVFLGWAAFVPLDAGVSAPGTVAVLGNRQTVQHKDGGVITAIHVREGQHVQAGQVLVELSAPELQAAERALTSDYLTLAGAARAAARRTHRPAQFRAASRIRRAQSPRTARSRRR